MPDARTISNCRFALTFAAALSCSAAWAQEVVPYHQDAPPNEPRTPDEAIAHMTVPPGFHVELVAAEPDLVNPVAMTFDARGRIWVTESLEYPRTEPGTGRDRVNILEDTDHDGRADKFTVFADGLNIPSGIAVGHGGVWVANAPDLLFLQDTNGDDQADVRVAVLSGFGRSDTHELPNSLTWGPDGWLYGLNGVFNHSDVEHPAGTHHKFNAAVWRYHPVQKKFELFAEGTSNPWGMAFNAEGEMFLSACVIDHLWHISPGGYYHRQAGAYPPFTWKMESIVDHAHQKAAYCGLCWFDSEAYPAEYRNRMYMGNIHGGCINVDTLEKNGSTYTAHAAPDFLTANDAWFMPVAQKVGPDGCLYILDWYDRYHCYQDARRDAEGIDRLKGRLYRVRYGDGPRPAPEDLEKLSDQELQERLAFANNYVRETVQQILNERHDGSFQAFYSGRREAKKRPYYSVFPMVPFDKSYLVDFRLTGLKHPDANVRKWSVRRMADRAMSERRTPVDDAWRQVIAPLVYDPAPEVRLELARLLANDAFGLSVNDRMRGMATLVDGSGDDPLIPRMVWQHLHPLLADQAQNWANAVTGSELAAPAWEEILPRSIERLAAAHPADVAAIEMLFAHALRSDGQTVLRPALAARCFQTLHQSRYVADMKAEQAQELRTALLPTIEAALAGPQDVALFADAAILAAAWDHGRGRDLALDFVATATAPDATRLAAWQALVGAREPRLLEQMSQHLGAESTCKPAMRRQMLAALGSWDDEQIGRAVVEAFSQLDAELQPAAVELLAQRSIWGKQLVAAVAAKAIPPAAVNVNQLRKLLAGADKSTREHIATIWGAVRTDRDPARDRVIRRTTELLESNHGDPVAGLAVFKKVCAQCHKLHGEGQEVGPDLTGSGRNSFVQLMSNVLDPSLVIGKEYQAYTAATNDGRTLVGLLVEDLPERIVLKLQGGKLETLARDEIETLEQSQLSMMPENLETQVSQRELIDLLTLLALDKPPTDESAKLLSDFPRPGQDAE